MDQENLVAEWLLPALRKSYVRLAGWMPRGIRMPESNRTPEPPRTEFSARALVPHGRSYRRVHKSTCDLDLGHISE